MPREDPDNPNPLLLPFQVVVDSNEQSPYHFTGIPKDGDPHHRNWIVPTVTKPLWAMGRREVEINGNKLTHGWADYSIDGLEALVQVERKSKQDAFSTLGQRRFEFQAEVEVLNQCKFAAIVVEADWKSMLCEPCYNSQVPPKVFSRTVLSWSIRYPRVHWFLAMDKRHAELITFRLLFRFWELNAAGEI